MSYITKLRLNIVRKGESAGKQDFPSSKNVLLQLFDVDVCTSQYRFVKHLCPLNSHF